MKDIEKKPMEPNFEIHSKYEGLGVSRQSFDYYSLIDPGKPHVDLVCRRCIPFMPWIFTIAGKELVIEAPTIESLVEQIRNIFRISEDCEIYIAFGWHTGNKISMTYLPQEESLAKKLSYHGVKCYTLDSRYLVD